MNRWIAIGYNRNENPCFLPDTNGDVMRFKTEVEAWEWINDLRQMYRFKYWKVIELDYNI